MSAEFHDRATLNSTSPLSRARYLPTTQSPTTNCSTEIPEELAARSAPVRISS